MKVSTKRHKLDWVATDMFPVAQTPACLIPVGQISPYSHPSQQ